MSYDVKQVIVMRNDLGMRKGKQIAQGAHASVASLLKIGQRDNGQITLPIVDDVANWMSSGFAKICLRVDSEEELLEIENKANELGLVNFLVTDRGYTEFNGVPTRTCIALGPAKSEIIDKITASLPLL